MGEEDAAYSAGRLGGTLIPKQILILLLLCAGCSRNVVCKVQSVYDGDTFRCDIDGWPAIVGKNIGIRINGIDCPEIREKRPEIKALGLRAKDFSENKLLNAQMVTLENIQRGKYFRLVADVKIDGDDLGEMLIKEGLAKPYSGKEARQW